jgi:hypothetical protein
MTKLVEHLINGGGSITIGLGNGLIQDPLILLESSDPTPEGYRDIASIVNLDEWGHRAKNTDYLRVRLAIKEQIQLLADQYIIGPATDEVVTIPTEYDYVANGNTANFLVGTGAIGLFAGNDGYVARYEPVGETWVFQDIYDFAFGFANQYEKDVFVKYSIGSTQAFLDAGYTLERINADSKVYHNTSIACRRDRLIDASIRIWNQIPQHAAEVVGYVFNPAYGVMYMLYQIPGVIGSLEDYDSVRNPNPGSGIVDYILARGPWAGVGIKDQPWMGINGQTMTEFTEELYDLLVRGIRH